AGRLAGGWRDRCRGGPSRSVRLAVRRGLTAGRWRVVETIIIDGKARADALRLALADEVIRLKAEHGLQPGLAVVLVGDDPASQIYVRSKGEQSLAAGMHSVVHRLPEATSQA